MPEFDRSRFREHYATTAERSITNAPIVHDEVALTPLTPTQLSSGVVKSKRAFFTACTARLASFRKWTHQEWKLLTGHQRTNAYVLLVLLVAATGVEIIQPMYSAKQYDLSPVAHKLIGESRDDTKQYLKLGDNKQSYIFEVPAQKADANSDHYGRNAATYSTNLSLDAKQGITYTDTVSKIDISIKPEFNVGAGEKVKGDSIVYPAGADQVVYTHKYNGLKEDIIVPSYRADELNYAFKLSLPAGVEARLDASGTINIYSADSKFFGNITYSSDKDRELLEKARQNAPKDTLVATIPAPIIKDANSRDYTNLSHFVLSEVKAEAAPEVDANAPAAVQQQAKAIGKQNTYSLSIVSNHLKDLAYPISIDPTITNSLGSDWAKGINEGGITIDTSGALIKRAGLTGGITPTWTQHGTNSIYSGIHSATTYNGVLYYGNGGSAVQMATLNTSTGQPGAFSSAGFTNRLGTLVAYNGYMYYLGNNGTDTINSVYAPINTNGTVGTFVSTGTGYATGHANAARQIYNGYVYIVGGDAAGSYTGTVQYAPINTDGSFGTFVTAGSGLNANRSSAGLVGYNNTLYVSGGNGPGALSSVEFAPIVNGVPGAWTSTTSMPSPRFRMGMTAWNGYLYVWGGDTGAANSDYADTLYAPILADGSVGAWASGGSFTGARRNAGNTMSNGVIYAVGGQITTTPTNLNDIWYSKISPVGTTGISTVDANTFTTSRDSQGTVVANGYLYILGGCNVVYFNCDTNAEVLSTTYYAAINATTGALGSFSAGTALPNARGFVAAAYYNGYIYVLGGSGNCGALSAYKNGCTDVYYNSVSPSNGALSGSWSTGSNLSTGVWTAAAAAYNGYIYVVEGRDTSTAQIATIQYASLDSDGSMNAFGTTANPGVNLEAPAVVADSGYLYIAFGYNGATNNANIYSSPISTSNGSLTGFSTAATNPIVADGGYLFVYNGNIYVADGVNSSNTYLYAVQYAPLTNGAVGSFTLSPNITFSTRRRGGSGGVYNGRLYTAGGSNSGGAITNSVDITPLNNGGSGATGTWAASATLGTGVSQAASVVSNGFVYVFGGDTSGTPTLTTAVQRAPINSDGTMGSWTTLSGNALTAARYRFSAVVVGNYVYLLGGSTAVGVYINTVEYALINADGSISTNSCGTSTTWCSTTVLPNTNWNNMGATAYNGNIYVVGGNNNGTFTNVYYAAPDSAGAISSWTAGTSLPSNLAWGPAVIAQNDYLYAIGGCAETTCTTRSSAVQVAPISGNGSLGSWTRTADVPTARRGATANIYNGYMYVAGGEDAGTNITSQYVQYAPLIGNGRLGKWSTSSINVNTRNTGFGYAANGRLCIGGGSASRTTTECAVLGSIIREATYSRIVDFDKGVLPNKIIVRGAPQGNGSRLGISYSTVTNTTGTVFATPTSSTAAYVSGGNVTPLSLPAGVSTSRYLDLNYMLDDSYTTSFPDTGGSTITLYDVYFTPNAGLRLRGGQTFTTQKSNNSLTTN